MTLYHRSRNWPIRCNGFKRRSGSNRRTGGHKNTGRLKWRRPLRSSRRSPASGENSLARNEQLIRQHKLIQLLELSRFGRTLEELRGDLVLDLGLSNLHTRTVRRDIEALQSAGFDIQTQQLDRGKVYKLGAGHADVHEIGISASEMIALAIGRELLGPLAGTQYWKGIETFWNKLQEAVPDGVYDHYSKHRETLFVFGTPNKSYERQEGMLKTINRAIVEHRVLEMRYQPINRDVSVRRVEPYGVAVYNSSIYVVAALPADEVSNRSGASGSAGKSSDTDAHGDSGAPEPTTAERMRNFKLDRFRGVTALDDYFKHDDAIKISELLSRSIGIFSGDSATQVRVRLSPRAAGWVCEDPWHPEQTLEAIGGGKGPTSRGGRELRSVKQIARAAGNPTHQSSSTRLPASESDGSVSASMPASIVAERSPDRSIALPDHDAGDGKSDPVRSFERGAILTVPSAHVRELLPKVLSLGNDAEVLSPPEFRDAVAETVNQMATAYSENG